MSPESYSWEIREQAEELYIIDGRTYEQVAEASGVSASQLKRWGTESEPSWSERRREYRQAQASVRRNVMLAKAKLIESVIESEDPQKAFAFNSLVSAGKALDLEARERAAGQAVMACAIPVDTTASDPVDVLTALSSAMTRKIGDLLAQPGAITLTAIKEVQQGLALLEKLQAKTATTDKKERQLDAAQIKELREQFGL